MSALDVVAAILGLLVAGGAGYLLKRGRAAPGPDRAGEILRSQAGAAKVIRSDTAREISEAEAGEVGTLQEEEARAAKALKRWRR